MATFEDLVNQGFIDFNASKYEYDYNEIYDEQTETIVELYEVGSRWKRQLNQFFGEDYDITCTRTTEPVEHSIMSYGRPCILFNFWDDTSIIRDDLHGSPSFNNFGCTLTLYAADVNGNPRVYETNVTFPRPTEFNHTYTGEDERVLNILNNWWNDPLGYGAAYMPDNAPWFGLYGKRGIFRVNVPMFKTLEEVTEYIHTGDDSGAVNPYHPPEPDYDIDGYEYYYNYTLYEADTVNHSKGAQIGTTKSAKFKAANANEYVAFVIQIDGSLKLESSANYVLIQDEDGQYTKAVPYEAVAINPINGYLYGKFGDLDTNIPIVNSLEEGRDIPPSKPPYNGIDEDMDNNTVSNLVSFINCYYVNNADLAEIGSVIYNSDRDAITALQEGLWMYNENPIDSIVDICYYPFSLSPFITGESSKKLKFGAFVCDGTVSALPSKNFDVITATNKAFTIINQRISPIYNDFRDYDSVTFTLYLPYVGMIPLDNVIIGNVLKVDVYLDIFTSTLKYYIYVKGSLYTTMEAAVGKHLAVMGTTWVTKSASNINDRVNIYSDAIGTGTNIGSAAGGGGGSAAGIVGSVVNFFKNGLSSNMNYLSKPSTKLSGSTSSGMNIFDSMSCYLITEQYQTIKPANLNSEYGKPTYKIAPISSCHGFTQISDCKLKSRASVDEYNEIITLLRNGIII